MIVLPTEKIPAKLSEPKVLLLYGAPKVGKTTVLADLPDCLTIDTEDGSDYVPMLKVKAKNRHELGEIAQALRKEPAKYKFLAFDTLTRIEDWAEELGTANYKLSGTGKNFTGQSVLTLPNGAGYLWLRLAFQELLGQFSGTVARMIFIGHLRDKFLQKEGKEVTAKDLDLTGKVKAIMCSQADTVGYMYRDSTGLRVSFRTFEDVLCGTRSQYLKGADILFDWKKIYPETLAQPKLEVVA